MLYQPWIYVVQSTKQAHYQPFINCTYWPVLGSYNNLNIIEMSPKSITSEAIDEIHKVILDGISESMASLVQSDMYGAINTAEKTTNGFYVIKFISEAYTLQKIQQFMDKLFCWWISCQGTISLLHERKHQLVLETTTNSTDHYIPNTHNNSSTSWGYHNTIYTRDP